MAAQMRTQEIRCFAATYRGKVQVGARFHYKAPCHVEVLRASHGAKAQPSCWRETGVSLVARFPTRPPCDSFLPTHCLVFGLSLLWGWVRSPEVLTRPRASAQGSQTFGFPPYAIVGRDDHFDWLSYKFAKASTHS